MTNISNPIVFFGTEDFSLNALTALVDAGFNVAAVVTKPDSPQGRGHKLTPPKVKTFAKNHSIPVWQPTKLSDITANISSLGSPVGVLVSYGKIVPQSIIDLFTPGIINVHPSLLPLYRGPSPIEAAILHGDAESGVSIMQLTAGMDAGPIYLTEKYPLKGNETSIELLNSLGTIGIQRLIAILPQIIDGSLTPTPQNDLKATYSRLIKKTDGVIDWSKPSTQIEREIRAYKGWPQSRTTLGSVEVIVTSARTEMSDFGHIGDIQVDNSTDTPLLAVQCGQGSLYIDSLKPIGKKEMPIQAFLSGYKSQITH